MNNLIKNKFIKHKIEFSIIYAFIFLIVLSWINEYFDITSLISDTPITPFNWRESTMESFIIAIIGHTAFLITRGSIRSRQKNEQAIINLAQELEKFQMAVDNSSDHIVITDENGKIIYANQAVEKITGYKISEIIGQKAGDKSLWGDQMKKDFYKKMWHIIKEEKKPFWGQLKNKRKDGTIYDAEVHISPILDKNNNIKYFIGLEMDITEAKKIERAKSEFVSLASHQLRSPMANIAMALDFIINHDSNNLNSEQKKQLSEINTDVYSLADLINGLLNLSRIEMGTFHAQLETINLDKILRIIESEIQAQVEQKQINLIKNYQYKTPNIITDKSILKIALQNLITNAVKYTPEMGLIKIGVIIKNNMLNVKVKDSGYGIPKSEQVKIFSRFFRANNIKQMDIPGSGIGLSLTKKLLTAVGGKIWFTSKENIGTTFEFILPIKIQKLDKN